MRRARVMRRVEVHPETVRQTSWHGYAARFVLGGGVTALAGLLGTLYGPLIGGLFLGFPSIAIASLTLVEKHHGKNAVGADAWGACLGSLGLMIFGAVVWQGAPPSGRRARSAPGAVLLGGRRCSLMAGHLADTDDDVTVRLPIVGRIRSTEEYGLFDSGSGDYALPPGLSGLRYSRSRQQPQRHGTCDQKSSNRGLWLHLDERRHGIL